MSEASGQDYWWGFGGIQLVNLISIKHTKRHISADGPGLNFSQSDSDVSFMLWGDGCMVAQLSENVFVYN